MSKKRLTTEEFIEKARLNHGDRYDYSDVVYLNARSKVRIICKKHGIFEQTPTSHLSGCGCPRCSENMSGRNISNTSCFIAKARLKHGDRYDYSLVEYKGASDKVQILCKKHGRFLQAPRHHLSGSGCPRCGAESLSVNMKSNSYDFIEKASKIHNRYDYSEVIYVDNNTKVKIICPEHGIFDQTPHSHLSGHGCPACVRKARYNFDTLSKAIINKHCGEIWLVEGQEIKNSNNKYKFRHICGYEWSAVANSVLKGVGCPNCAVSGYKTNLPAIFYILKINGSSEFIGFGITNKYKQRKTQHKKNLKANNCSIVSEILIHSDGFTIQKLEQYIKLTLQCNNSTITGFKTESVLISPEELLDFCVKWLTKQKVIYKIESKNG